MELSPASSPLRDNWSTAGPLRIEHPEPGLIRKQLNSLRLEVAIEPGSSPALVAIFEGANDLIELR
jgi:hypothetical protein